MGLGDKIQNAAEKAGGKAKATAGAATGDDSLKAEETDQAKGDLQAGEKSKTPSKKTEPELSVGAHPFQGVRPHPLGRVRDPALAPGPGARGLTRLPGPSLWRTSPGRGRRGMPGMNWSNAP